MHGDLGKETCVNIFEEIVLEGILYYSLQLFLTSHLELGYLNRHLTYIVPFC